MAGSPSSPGGRLNDGGRTEEKEKRNKKEGKPVNASIFNAHKT
jgi:hypothetical protein